MKGNTGIKLETHLMKAEGFANTVVQSTDTLEQDNINGQLMSTIGLLSSSNEIAIVISPVNCY